MSEAPPQPSAPAKKKIVLKRAAGTNANELPACRIKIELDSDNNNGDNMESLGCKQVATIVSARYMTDNSNDSESQVDIKRVIEMTLDLNDTNSSYQPGDYVAVYAPNPDYQIKTLISRLQLTENKVIKIESLDSKY
ncbi:hypothetical protein DICPUDRAFT_83434, partial [Dictyostelium purpureum]